MSEYRRAWHAARGTFFRLFYHLHCTEIDKRRRPQRKPYVTVCLLLDDREGMSREPPTLCRGISVCHPLDAPNLKRGRLQANVWAEKAAFHQRNAVAAPTTHEIRDRLVYTLEQNVPLMIPLVLKDGSPLDLGHWNTEPVGSELTLLAKRGKFLSL